jgi:hypothetical protein
MEKPNGYDSAEAKQFKEFDRPNAGGHVFKILDVSEGRAKSSGRNQLTLTLDIARGPYTNFYDGLSSNLNKDCFLKAYWGVDGDQLPYFKGNMQMVEKCNPGFKFNFDERALIGKLIGGNLREEEYAKDGDLKTSLKIAFFCSIEDVPNQKPLDVKKLGGRPRPQAATNQNQNTFSDGVPLPEKDDTPF